jgi:peroxiredoxin Q/BCP
VCRFRDLKREFEELNTIVLGVSPDDVDSHQNFISKFDLNMPLLADTDQNVCKAYGVWKDRGGGRLGVERSTFVIDTEGNLSQILRQVDPEEHIDQVLTFLREG